MIRHAGDEIGFFTLPCVGEIVSGDDCFIRMEDGHLVLALVDGAGHGPAARQVTELALDILGSQPLGFTAEEHLADLHAKLKRTKGGAIAVVSLQASGSGWKGAYRAVGDIRMAVLSSDTVKLLPAGDGVVGYAMRAAPAGRLELVQGDILLMASDGIHTGFEGRLVYSQLPAVALDVARRVVFDHKLDHDDSSCLAFRIR